MSNTIDFFENYCLVPNRPVNNKFPTLEALQAEMWICTYFKNYYEKQYGGSNTYVITGLSYLTQDYRGNTAFKSVEQFSSNIFDGIRQYSEYYLKGMPKSKVLNIILKWLRSDFRNMYSNKKDFSKLSGGLRKPDILGIRFEPDRIIFEMVEVTTHRQAGETIIEDLESKKEILEKGVVPFIENEINDTQIRTGKSIGPTKIDVIYSKWKPEKNQLIIPLLSNLNGSKNPKYEWICYKPTFRYNNGHGQDGLILYEIHSTGNSEMVPKRVLEKVAFEIRKLMRQHTFELTLTPFLNNYWNSNVSDKQELIMIIGLGMGMSLVIVLAILLLPETAVGATVATAYTATETTVLSAKTIAAVSSGSVFFPRMLSIAEQVINSLKLSPAF